MKQIHISEIAQVLSDTLFLDFPDTWGAQLAGPLQDLAYAMVDEDIFVQFYNAAVEEVETDEQNS